MPSCVDLMVLTLQLAPIDTGAETSQACSMYSGTGCRPISLPQLPSSSLAATKSGLPPGPPSPYSNHHSFQMTPSQPLHREQGVSGHLEQLLMPPTPPQDSYPLATLVWHPWAFRHQGGPGQALSGCLLTVKFPRPPVALPSAQHPDSPPTQGCFPGCSPCSSASGTSAGQATAGDPSPELSSHRKATSFRKHTRKAGVSLMPHTCGLRRTQDTRCTLPGWCWVPRLWGPQQQAGVSLSMFGRELGRRTYCERQLVSFPFPSAEGSSGGARGLEPHFSL